MQIDHKSDTAKHLLEVNYNKNSIFKINPHQKLMSILVSFPVAFRAIAEMSMLHLISALQISKSMFHFLTFQLKAGKIQNIVAVYTIIQKVFFPLPVPMCMSFSLICSTERTSSII